MTLYPFFNHTKPCSSDRHHHHSDAAPQDEIMRRLILLITILAFAQMASAEVLWDQSDFDPWGAGFFNSESGAPPMGMTVHSVSDITVPDGYDWFIDSITTYYSGLDMFWSDAIIEGYVHLFPKTGALPTEDPTASAMVPMTGVFVDDHHEVTASGLNLHLTPGDYWIGITPVAPGGIMGPEIHLGSISAMIGDPSPSYDAFGFPAPMWYQPWADMDATILINGDMAVPTEETTFSGIKALY